MSNETGYWKSIVPPPHEHVLPMDRLNRGPFNHDDPAKPIGVGSVWVCPCGAELTYTGDVNGLFRVTKEAPVPVVNSR